MYAHKICDAQCGQTTAVRGVGSSAPTDHTLAATLRRCPPYPRVTFENPPPGGAATLSGKMAPPGYHRQQYRSAPVLSGPQP